MERANIMINIRIFKADNREAAENMALDYFGCGKNALTFEQLGEQAENAPCELVAFKGTAETLANVDGWYNLLYEADGVYLEVFNARGKGNELNREDMQLHIKRKNLASPHSSAISDIPSTGCVRVKIAPPQQENFYGEEIVVEVSADESEAYAKLLPGEFGGAEATLNDLNNKIKEARITHGIIEEEVGKFINNKRYDVLVTIAKAVPPQDGEDGRLVFHFSTDEKTHKPMEIEGGRVDYRSLDIYEPVTQGQLLVERLLATEGTPGATVTGRSISQKRGKEASMIKGKNVTIDDEKRKMHSTSAGMVEFIGGSVNVMNVYEVKGDVDWSVGNIDFDGSVNIKGNVNAGHIIKATGSVLVGGVVETSEIISGGNIEIKRGMQGMDRGKIKAEGNINILYIERGVAEAGGDINVDMSVHSFLRAGGSVIAKGKRGSIVGGHASAGEEIIAKNIGSVSCVQTDVEVGFPSQKRERLTYLEKELDRLEGDMIKLDQLDAHLKKTKGKLDEDTWQKLYLSGGENRRKNAALMDEYFSEMKTLQAEIQAATRGKVHVLDTAYGGASIKIASETYRIDDDINFATFKHKDGEIVWGPCEAKKN